MAHELDDGPDGRRATTERSAGDRKDPDVDAEAERLPDDRSDRDADRTNGDAGTHDGGGNAGGAMWRREYLKAGAVAAVTGVVASSGASAEREGVRFERVVDAVEDLAADPTGSTPVNGSLVDLPRNSLVRFPEGTYLIDGRIPIDGHDTVGLQATGTATVIGSGADSGLDIAGVDRAYYGGFSHGRSGGAVRHRWDVSERLRIRNVDYRQRGRANTTTPTGATGVADADGSGSLLEIVADGTSTTYDVTVSDGVRAVESGGTPTESDVSGSCAEGSVTDGVHAFRYGGAITAIDVGGDADVYLNGIELDVESKPVDPRLQNVVVVDPNDLGTPVRYRFAADGDAAVEGARTTRRDHGWESLPERIDGGVVSGRVADDVDAYRFAGDLNSLAVDGPARVAVGNGH